MKLACLGPKGTFSEEAAFHYNDKAEIICFHTIEDVILSLCNNECDLAIVPMENSIEGIVNATLDTLIFETNLYIKAQLELQVINNLLVKQSYNGEKLEKILSHPQPLAQCRKFTRQQYPGVLTLPTASTAAAALEVLAANEHCAAIGSAKIAQIYDLKILHESIQQKGNVTTFAVLSKEDTTAPKMNHKISIAFSTKNEPGELYKILGIFALWDMNMTKIVSRPAKDRAGEYVFLIDIEGYNNVDDVNSALTMVKRKTIFYKNLGSYPIIGSK